MRPCAPASHEYVEFAGGAYYKLATHNGAGFTYDQSVSYQKLYCQKCAHTIEVIARDRRRGTDEKEG